jgi:TspO/MBR family.
LYQPTISRRLVAIRISEPENECRENLALLVSVVLSLLAGFAGAWFAPDMAVTYEMMYKPSIAPPSWAFGPVWAFLYILAGISAYRVFAAGHDAGRAKDALFYYGVLLALNFIWPILFFRFGLKGVALLEIILLAVLAVVTAVKFSLVDSAAGWLMVPYMIWVIYACILNFSVLNTNL